MPIRWDEKNKLTLLLRIVERCPPSQDDLKWVLESWPDSEKPTLRAIQEQMKSLKKQMTNGSSPKTPRSLGSTKKISFTPKSSQQKITPTMLNKKRKIDESDLEEESPVLTDSEEEKSEAMRVSSDDDNPILTPSKRLLPARGKSRGLKLDNINEDVTEEDSDDSDEDSDEESDEESEFDYQKSRAAEKEVDDKRSVASKRSWRTALESQTGSEDEI